MMQHLNPNPKTPPFHNPTKKFSTQLFVQHCRRLVERESLQKKCDLNVKRVCKRNVTWMRREFANKCELNVKRVCKQMWPECEDSCEMIFETQRWWRGCNLPYPHLHWTPCPLKGRLYTPSTWTRPISQLHLCRSFVFVGPFLVTTLEGHHSPVY
jgi:hypothetical protein